MLINPFSSVAECSLAPFVTGTMTQKIPFVFLPLKGQIVHPSAEIHFSGKLKVMETISVSQATLITSLNNVKISSLVYSLWTVQLMASYVSQLNTSIP
jgi:hypothetical protein